MLAYITQSLALCQQIFYLRGQHRALKQIYIIQNNIVYGTRLQVIGKKILSSDFRYRLQGDPEIMSISYSLIVCYQLMIYTINFTVSVTSVSSKNLDAPYVHRLGTRQFCMGKRKLFQRFLCCTQYFSSWVHNFKELHDFQFTMSLLRGD